MPGPQLATLFGDLARSLLAEPALEDTLQAIVRATAAAVPVAHDVGIALVSKGGRLVGTGAASGELVHRVDQVARETGQGPCLTAAVERATIRTDDLAAERRWPLFAPRAVGLGARSILSFPLVENHTNPGSFNLYSLDPGAFDGATEQLGMLLASHAGLAIAGAQRRRHFDAALASRDTVGQAKGVLMERYKISADEAFEVLVRASSRSNRKVHDIAALVAETGEDPLDAACRMPRRDELRRPPARA